MMTRFLTYFLVLLFVQTSTGQDNTPWIWFYDDSTKLSGFRDLEGNIKVPAKFKSFLNAADTFYHIMPVTERIDGKPRSYYLLKDGRKIGIDSVYSFDWTLDCESEGKIRYYDRTTDRVGFFDKHGKAIIPATYNYASPFRNGLSLAKINAVRKCWDEETDEIRDQTNCEHWGWDGGEYVLINEKNEVIAENIVKELWTVNWYARTTDDSAIDTNLYTGIQGRSDTTFWFLDYQKEFSAWFYKVFLNAVARKDSSFQDYLFTEISYTTSQGWKHLKKELYLEAFPGTLTPERFSVDYPNSLSISSETVNPFMDNHYLFRRFYDACGDHSLRHPAFHVMVTYYKKRDQPNLKISSAFYREYATDYQEHFKFIKTVEGYKLFEVSVKR